MVLNVELDRGYAAVTDRLVLEFASAAGPRWRVGVGPRTLLLRVLWFILAHKRICS